MSEKKSCPCKFGIILAVIFIIATLVGWLMQPKAPELLPISADAAPTAPPSVVSPTTPPPR